MKHLLALALLMVPTLTTHGADVTAGTPTWPQWRGPNRDGTSTGPAWPDSLAERRLERLWRIDLGEGYPGPIVTRDRIFVAETKEDEIVRALDRKTGKQLWQTRWKGAMTVFFIARANGSWIRSTPAYDGDSLYVAGMRDVLVCLDATTGKERWRADLKERYNTGLPPFGFVCSPLVDDTGVYVQAAASFLKLDRKTGKTLWRTLVDGGGMYGNAFSSPVKATLAGKTQLVVQTRRQLAGIDPATGKELWSRPIPADKGMNILTPTIHGDRVLTSAYGSKTFLFQIEKDGAAFTAKEAWNLPGDANMTSPVIVGGHAYFLLRNQRLTCIDLDKGKTRWTTTRTFGKYWSMAVRGDRILALDQRGLLFLIQANPDRLVLLDERRISKQETWGHLAVVGNEIHIRELTGLAVYRWK